MKNSPKRTLEAFEVENARLRAITANSKARNFLTYNPKQLKEKVMS